MTTNKPEVVAYATHHDEPMLFPSKREAAMYGEDGEEPVALIRLSDYERLQAECEKLVEALGVSAQTEQPELYTCVGKGGVYELIGRAFTAGVLRVTSRFADEVIVYRDTETNAFYCRELGDFRLRMARAAQRGEE